MITAEEAKAYTKEFQPNELAQKVLNELERQIKNGERHPRAYTTRLCRTYAEDLAKYCRSLGYKNARIEDVYSRYGVKGGNYLQIDL